jgi:CelD/BcsL family acetyltransferase involved in cellulose biosynthesis
MTARPCHRIQNWAAAGTHLNEVGEPSFDALTIEHNGILAGAAASRRSMTAALVWFAGMSHEADELYFSGSMLCLPEEAVKSRGLGRSETSVPSYSVELALLAPGGGVLYPVLSANARQQLRRAFRSFERRGSPCLTEAATLEEALKFFAERKAWHCTSWERRGKVQAFTGAFFEPFHRRLIESCFDDGGIQLLRASVGERIIGYLYNFRQGSRIYAYQPGFAEAARGERLGVVAHALARRLKHGLAARMSLSPAP